ncbi:MAG: NB-ARC domain-containing protein [Chloroflexota bacterium]
MSYLPDHDPAALEKDVHDALKTWRKPDRSEREFLAYLSLVQEQRAKTTGSPTARALRQATNDVLLGGLTELEEQDKTEARVLRERFIEGRIADEVAQRLHVSRDRVNDWQKAAVQHLGNILLSQEKALRQSQQERWEVWLPPPTYSHLFGLEQAIQTVAAAVRRPAAPWVIAIAGIGGIGKTSLADAVARRLSTNFTYKRAVWLDAGDSAGRVGPQQNWETVLAGLAHQLWPEMPGIEAPGQRLTRLRQTLKAEPHLVIIDDLEREADVTAALDQVSTFLGPSKFLLTTRAHLLGAADVFSFSLDELALPDALALLRHQADLAGLPDLAAASQSDLEAIYQVVGGNPLALKLVVGLARALPLAQILADLTQSRPGPIEGLYRHIYWEAWRTLSEPAQTLLQAMPLVAGSGATPEHLQRMSGLPTREFLAAVEELFTRSLLEARGSTQARRYGIHRLTETFLRTEIIHWPD